MPSWPRSATRFGQHRPNERLVDALEQVRYRLAQEHRVQTTWMNAVSSRYSAVGSKEIGSLGGKRRGYMYMCTMRSLGNVNPRRGVAEHGHLVARAFDPDVRPIRLAGEDGVQDGGNVAVHPAAQTLVLHVAQAILDVLRRLELVRRPPKRSPWGTRWTPPSAGGCWRGCRACRCSPSCSRAPPRRWQPALIAGIGRLPRPG